LNWGGMLSKSYRFKRMDNMVFSFSNELWTSRAVNGGGLM
jgi:hypothetical protein